MTLVGHSMGGLVSRAYLRRYGSARVAGLVTLGTPHRGSMLAWVLGGESVSQLRPDCQWLAALNRPPEPKELDFAQTYLSGGMNRAERAQDLLWALLNSNAFLFNR